MSVLQKVSLFLVLCSVVGLLVANGRVSFANNQQLLIRKFLFTNKDDDLLVPIQSSTKNKKWESSKSVVIGLAVGYGLREFKSFVGSLRATGYNGHIILGIHANAPEDVQTYLRNHNVTMKVVELTKDCTFYNLTDVNGVVTSMHNLICAKAYPDYKIQWSRFPLARDWLLECTDCTDGVMLTDTRDAFFQQDPFQYKPQLQKPIMLFEEIYPNQTTKHWLTDYPVPSCRKFHFNSTPMLCSGSTMGSREGILHYIQVMMEEFEYWISRQECRFNMVGDDQSIHNYLYYSGRLALPSDNYDGQVVSIPHRTGPIHVVGVQAAIIIEDAIEKAMKDGRDKNEAWNWVSNHRLYGDDNTSWRNWLGPEHDLIDPETGYILNLDGTPSPQVHQFDRFGSPFDKWLNRVIDEEWSS